MSEISQLQGWTTFVFYGTVFLYGIVILLSVVMHNDFKRGFQDSNGEFSSRIEKYFYYFFKITYSIIIITLGIALYFMNTILTASQLI